MTTLIIDGDPLIYKAGSIKKVMLQHVVENGEHIGYMAKFTDVKDITANETGYLFKTLDESKAYLDELLTNIANTTKATDAKIFLTPSDKSNFRYKLNRFNNYKANRSDAIKPRFFKELREYLIREYDASVAIDQEADDECGIAATQYPDSIICSSDKDLLYGLPGNKFNYDVFKSHYMDVERSTEFFCKQLLMGDTADNIGGIYNCGDKSATKVLNSVDLIFKKYNYTDQVLGTVLLEYYNRLVGLHPQEIYDRFNETAHLLWVRRKPNDSWQNYFKVKDIVKLVLGSKVIV